jgi:shikimate kinase
MNLYLIGYRGSGKSTVAPLVAELLDREWLDSDQQVELLAGCNVSQIFQQYDEAAFRQWETTVIEALSRKDTLVVSLGGGAVLAKDNRELLARTGKTVWLTAPATELWRRIAADHATKTLRPNLTDLEGMAEVVQVLAQRTEIYKACADYAVDTSGMSPKHIAEEIANWFEPVDR